ncbi:MAG TPA: bifunctional hydroxymethylpyrimidine kinase/phosphomethylpyrimidine kinase [Devosiaceae bacterium]|nr:bifunctional hydroxymethylpyrimidine kinase/phosphomethylpyrimidine kinase [Devosiaceae bacterium]
MTPIALTIAGSDSSGGAGIQADLKTFARFGVYGASVITAVTAQNTLGVRGIHPIPPEMIGAQIDAVLEDLDVAAIKIGMIGSAAAIEAIAAALARHPPRPVVLDPVMIATTGARLLPETALDALFRLLFPKTLLVTPNLIEAAAIANTPIAKDEAEMIRQAQIIQRTGAPAVLVKGGHGSGPESIDLLVRDGIVTRFVSPRIEAPQTHGTGCTLSSAIAAGLANGQTLTDAIEGAKALVSSAIAAAASANIGHGAKPLHHAGVSADRHAALDQLGPV